jgi:hypothetical protein
VPPQPKQRFAVRQSTSVRVAAAQNQRRVRSIPLHQYGYSRKGMNKKLDEERRCTDRKGRAMCSWRDRTSVRRSLLDGAP